MDYLKKLKKVPTLIPDSTIIPNLLSAFKYYKFRCIQNKHLAFDRQQIDENNNDIAIRTECLACDLIRRLMGDGSMPYGSKDITSHVERSLWDSVFFSNATKKDIDKHHKTVEVRNCHFTAANSLGKDASSSRFKGTFIYYIGMDETGVGAIICEHGYMVKSIAYHGGEL